MGYSLNDSNPVHIKQAEQDLQSLTPQVRGVVGDEITMMLQQNEGHIAVVWSGVAAPLVQEEILMIMWFLKKVRMYGLITWLFLKLLKIKKAHINLLTFIRCKNNKQNTEWVGYATPNKAARNLLPNNIK